MEGHLESNSSEEQVCEKSSCSANNANSRERTTSDVMVVYEYDNDDPNDDYDLAIDGMLLNGCSQYLFKFSIIVLPIIFLMVIVIAVFESDSHNNELRCKVSQIECDFAFKRISIHLFNDQIGKAFIVLGISVGLLAFYFLCRYGCHIRRLYRQNRMHRQSERHNTSDDQIINGIKKNTITKKQMKFLLQNPWHRVSESEPRDKYSNHIDVYVENGLYVNKNDIV